MLNDKLETVRLDTARFVISALVLLSVLIVPLVEVRLVNVAELLLNVVMCALVAVSRVAVRSLTVEDVNVKLLMVALVAVRFVTVQLEPTSVPTVPLVEVRFVSVAELLVSVVMFPLTAVNDCAFVITALSIVLPLSVAGMSALTNSLNAERESGPLAGPAYTRLAATGAMTRAVPHVYAPDPPDTKTCPIDPAGPNANCEPVEYTIVPAAGDKLAPVPPRPIGKTPVVSEPSLKSNAG